MKILGLVLNRFLGRKRLANHSTEKFENQTLDSDLEQNLRTVTKVLGDSVDVVTRRMDLPALESKGFLLFIEGMVDKTFLAENIIKPLVNLNAAYVNGSQKHETAVKILLEKVLAAGVLTDTSDLGEVIEGVLAGNAVLFVHGSKKALIISSEGYQTRGVQEPEQESILRGPREGFTEAIQINITLIRRKIQNPNLRVEILTIGRQTRTKICLVYLKGVYREPLLKELKTRINRIDTDMILGAGNLEQLIEDVPLSPYATVGNTERPDVAAAKILEGRIAIIVNGTPIVLTVPHIFIESFQTADDYLIRPYYMTVIRWVRFFSYFLTIFLPPLYIAVMTYHQEMIPTPLLISMAAAREGVPFPSMVEALGMGLVFEILREAGIRMPRPVGQAVSIVGALVIGEAAVNAGLVGAPMVIVTALTAISSFVVPAQIDVTTLLRFILTVLAGVSGFYGILLGTLILIIHAISLRSFGIPYLTPLAPLNLSDLKDVLVSVPAWARKRRPKFIGKANPRRQAEFVKPGPPPDKN